MPRNWLFFCVVSIAVSAFAGTAHGQPPCAVGETAQRDCDQDNVCTTTCVKTPPKVKRPPVKKVDIPPPAALPSTAKSSSPPAPPVVGSPPATPEPPEGTPLIMPNCEPGKFVVMRKGAPECMTESEVKEKLDALKARLAELESAHEVVAPEPEPTAAELEIKKIQKQLEDLKKANSDYLKQSGEAHVKIEGLKSWTSAVDERLSSALKGLDAQASAISKNEERIAALEAGSSLGMQFGAHAGFHILQPYGRMLWNTGVDLTLLPAMSERWRFLIGGGFGYAGKNSFDEHLMFASAVLGAQPSILEDLVKDLHLAFGAVMEQRFSTVNLDSSSYGAFVEPKYCTGIRELKPHLVCFGLPIAGAATVFVGPETGERFVRPDLSLGLTIGYAHLP